MITMELFVDCMETIEASIPGFKLLPANSKAWKSDLDKQGFTDEDMLYGAMLLRQGHSRPPALADVMKYCNEAKQSRQKEEWEKTKKAERDEAYRFWDEKSHKTDIAKDSLKLIYNVLNGVITKTQLIQKMRDLEPVYPGAGWMAAANNLEKRSQGR